MQPREAASPLRLGFLSQLDIPGVVVGDPGLADAAIVVDADDDRPCRQPEGAVPFVPSPSPVHRRDARR
jgi:hypothetical protein